VVGRVEGGRLGDLELHQRTPLFLGSAEMVEKAMEFMAKYAEESVQK